MTARTVAVVLGRSPAARYSVHRGYVDGVFAAGATPVLVAAGSGGDPDRVAELIRSCDAVLITGGSDVDPALYGQVRGRGEKDTDPERDVIEAEAVRAAHDAGRPVLGICRGIQLLAAAFGGTLIPDLPSAGFGGHEDEPNEGQPVHAITADPATLALRVLAGAGNVNSIHHQAVAEPGPFLTATAWSDDGVIEAVEAPGLLGVQWHPERLLAGDPRHLAPFEWLVSA